MKILNFDFIDQSRVRKVPVLVYLPYAHSSSISTVIFNPGFQSQKELVAPNIKYAYKNYHYLANYFTKHGYAFVTIQHDILGDNDGLEAIDSDAPQHEAREHLYVRGVSNIFFVFDELKKQKINLDLSRCIMGGHSNGGDIAKYFANLHGEMISHLILFDARRCRLEVTKTIKLLMFEADDTSTDTGVLPEPKKEDNIKRSSLEWTIIKPHNTMHMTYTDKLLTETVKTKIFKSLDWFLSTNKME